MIAKIREYSIPLILGVILALVWANISYESYYTVVYSGIFGTEVNLHFLVNDIFMVLFFATAGIELVHSLTPGGALYPINKAVTPLFATIGGVLGPIGVYFILNYFLGSPEYLHGWGITTATDIALAWLLARLVFGKSHPAVNFLLLLAVVDDGIGLAIIAIFYPDPLHPVVPQWLFLVLAGMLISYIFKRKGIQNWMAYIATGGILAWLGMYNAHLHPALSLVFIVPFLPRKNKFESSEEEYESTALIQFQKKISPIVDFGLIFFGLTNAGVEFGSMSNLTFIICASLMIGKTLGVSLFSYLATLMAFKLPDGMRAKEVVMAGIVAGMGLTVALFVATQAFTDMNLQSAAKMGALFTVLVFIIGPIFGKILKIQKVTTPKMAHALKLMEEEGELEFDVAREVDLEAVRKGTIGKEKAMEEKIEKLEKRIEELEKKLQE